MNHLVKFFVVYAYVDLKLKPNSTKRHSIVQTLTPSKVAISRMEKQMPMRNSSWSLGIEYFGRPRCPVKAVAGEEEPDLS